jgi:TonB-dependent receptor
MIALSAGIALPSAALAQDAGEETVIVTGIRGSLERAMDIKRNATGVVDAISAEDIGDFPDTNLAESLQRITGVSINRVNGEGSEVTVRGFGANFNLVTLNGRTMPTANVATVGGDQTADTVVGAGRSFDFSNLASEGVSGLEVYKTGRASIPTGGIGATINVRTLRPLDNPGLDGSIAIKGVHDTGVDMGNDITPEISGLFSWSDPNERFGVSLFASYQERNGSTRSATVNGWAIIPYSAAQSTFAGPGVDQTNAPTDPDQLVGRPNDSRYHLANFERERLNTMLTVQFRPTDNLTLTMDGLYASNEIQEMRTDQTNWFQLQGTDTIVWSDSAIIPSTEFFEENYAPGSVFDVGYENQFRANDDTLTSVGFNAEWDLTDSFSLIFDAHTSRGESLPGAPNGTSSTMFGMGANVKTGHSLDLSSGFPVQAWTFDDTTGGNNNGVLDLGDIGSQVARTTTSSQVHDVEEMTLAAAWATDGGSRLDFGINWRDSEMNQRRTQTQQALGDWGLTNPGDVETFAPGLVETYCLSCLFDDFSPGPGASVAFRGNAVDLYNILSPIYANQSEPGLNYASNSVNTTTNENRTIREEISSAYVEFNQQGDFLGRPSNFTAGVRYEYTEVESVSLQSVPTAIYWEQDNDFNRQIAAGAAVTATADYEYVLPSFDFAVDITDDLVGRISLSRTIARAGYGQLFADTTAANPGRPTAIPGTIVGGTLPSPGLLPLESDNFDVSLEWYYGDASFVSVGFYEKRVSNFIGTSQVDTTLFDLRDVSSGAPGSRSGFALEQLNDLGANVTEGNLFSMTAIIENRESPLLTTYGLGPGSTVQDAIDVFEANLDGDGDFDADIDQFLDNNFDIFPDANDPLMNFSAQQNINNRDARLYGFEIAGQHFFGDTGFGVAASYTSVDGDVEYDNAADPSVNQFALLGLSDTYNVTLIYENFGLAGRLAYNWRDTALIASNVRGGNPVYTDEFGQLDLAISYDLTDRIQLQFEGINLTEESRVDFGRTEAMPWFIQELDARYMFGARYRFGN